MTMTHKMYAILAIASALSGTMTFAGLASLLNAQGLRTNRGTPYKGGRGVARLLSAAYDHGQYVAGLSSADLGLIAEKFTDRNGYWAWEK